MTVSVHNINDGSRRHKIVLAVIIGHIVFIGGPLLWYAIVEWFKPEPETVLQVRLVSASDIGDKTAAAPAFEPVKPVDIPPPPKPVKLPEPIKPQQPVTPPKPVIPSKPQPTFRPSGKTVVKPQPKPEPKTVTRVTSPNITVSTNIIRRDPPVKTTTSTPAKTREQLEAELRAALQRQQGAIGTPQQGINSMVVSYAQRIGAYLRPQWNQPAREDVGGRQPEVAIKINVSASGNVISAVITRPSGIAAMDNSVKRLLNSLRRVPAPPSGIRSVELIMALSDS
ncbi:MAG: TonB family protein [Victivallales bacterium]|nr:TonB family protein [Victivallales bacterium]